jgi:transcription elongation factor GreB
VAAAAALGDRSENADYIYGKRQLGEIDRRIRYLDKRISTMQVVDRLPSDTSKIYFGAWVKLRHCETDDSYTYRIVGPDEIDQDPAYISVDSPMAKALMGKLKGENICVLQTAQNSKVLNFDKTPDPTEYEIIGIRYAKI